MHVRDIHDMRLKRAEVNHQTYKQLFQACCERIRRRAAMPRAPDAMLFVVPPFVWGRPPFKHAHAIRYVAEKLRRNGFEAEEAQPGTLHVRWGHAPPPRQPPRPPRPARRPKQPAQPKLSARLAALRRALA